MNLCDKLNPPLFRLAAVPANQSISHQRPMDDDLSPHITRIKAGVEPLERAARLRNPCQAPVQAGFSGIEPSDHCQIGSGTLQL
jgi:hypothetical protein